MSIEQQWDIVSGVGITALAVAAARAAETRRPGGLVDDPHAAPLVEAANAPLLHALISRSPGGPTTADLPESADPAETAALFEQAANYVGMRSRFFDTWFDRVVSAGVRQAVVLASGLDTRAFRLRWPAGTRVFEIDQPKVLAFKDSVLDATGATASCERHTVGVDLRDDWATALKDAGFDSGEPTAWLAEGLLPYLPADAEYALLDTIHGNSAPGSHVAIESISGARERLTGSAIETVSRTWGIDLSALMSDEERADPADRLAAHGWVCTPESLAEVAERHGRTVADFAAHLGAEARMLTAHLPG